MSRQISSLAHSDGASENFGKFVDVYVVYSYVELVVTLHVGCVLLLLGEQHWQIAFSGVLQASRQFRYLVIAAHLDAHQVGRQNERVALRRHHRHNLYIIESESLLAVIDCQVVHINVCSVVVRFQIATEVEAHIARKRKVLVAFHQVQPVRMHVAHIH